MAGHYRVPLVACCALMLASLPSSAGASATPALPKNAVFKAVTPANIESVRNEINASANERNSIPAGTVLVYKTSAGNLGKMQILKYGYNLRVKFITYRHGGGILLRRDNFLVKGTYLYDLDRGRAQSEGSSAVDFWWDQDTHVLRYLVFKNGASFTVVR